MVNIEAINYSVLRYGGASQARACAEMGVNFGRACWLEAAFRRRRCEDEGPRFARCGAHVRAVMTAGGFPVLTR